MISLCITADDSHVLVSSFHHISPTVSQKPSKSDNFFNEFLTISGLGGNRVPMIVIYSSHVQPIPFHCLSFSFPVVSRMKKDHFFSIGFAETCTRCLRSIVMSYHVYMFSQWLCHLCHCLWRLWFLSVKSCCSRSHDRLIKM